MPAGQRGDLGFHPWNSDPYSPVESSHVKSSRRHGRAISVIEKPVPGDSDGEGHGVGDSEHCPSGPADERLPLCLFGPVAREVRGKSNGNLNRKVSFAPLKRCPDLATNLTRSLRKVVSVYRERMQEEESFRDLKSHRYGFAFRYVKLSKAGRYDRMLAVWAIEMWLFFTQGLAAAQNGLDRGLSTASNRRRDLSLIRIGVMQLQRALGPPAALLDLLSCNPHLKRWG